MEHSSLPIIDYAALSGAPEARRQMLAKLGQAAREVGFFYLTGHGLSEAEQQETLGLAARFFALPEQEKRSVQMVHSPHFRGYNQVGAELTRARPDRREQFDIMGEEAAIDADALHQPWQRLTGPNQWPAALPEMKTHLLDWQARLTDITLGLLSAFAEVLEQPADVFDASIRGAPYQHMKLIHYPGQEAGGGQGVGAHKDPGYLTLVMQDDHSGLEVETARLDATVPLLSLSPELAAEAQGPESDPTNPLFYQVGENVLKGRLRSHPDVAARHYASSQGQTQAAAPREPQPA